MQKKQIVAIAIGLVALITGGVLYKVYSGPEKIQGNRDSLGTRLLSLPPGVLVTESQKQLLQQLDAKYAPKFLELEEVKKKILSPEQVTAQRTALAKLNRAGKRGKALVEGAEQAAKITPEQKRKLLEVREQIEKIRLEARKQLSEILAKP